MQNVPWWEAGRTTKKEQDLDTLKEQTNTIDDVAAIESETGVVHSFCAYESHNAEHFYNKEETNKTLRTTDTNIVFSNQRLFLRRIWRGQRPRFVLLAESSASQHHRKRKRVAL
jgi:hypothetical protein